MGKGSSKTKNEKNQDRNFYTFTLNNKDPRDKELIDFLADRPTTASVKEGLRLLMENTNQNKNPISNNQEIIQIFSLLASALNSNSPQNNLSNILSQLNQNVSQTNNEQAVSLENTTNFQEPKQESEPEFTEEEKVKIKKGTGKALAALDNYDF